MDYKDPNGQLDPPGRLGCLSGRPAAGCDPLGGGRLIESGCVTVDGKPAGKSTVSRAGETVSVILPQMEEPEALPEDIPLDVVYEDGDVIVVNKPVGMVVHPSPRGTRTAHWSTPCLHHCAGSSRASAANCAPASSTASTGTPAGSSSPPRTTPPIILSGRPAGGPHPGPDLRVPYGSGKFQGGQRHRGSPHRPSPDGPEKDGRGADGRRRDPLGGYRPLPGRHPSAPRLETGRTHRSACTWPTLAPTHPGGHGCTGAKNRPPASPVSVSTPRAWVYSPRHGEKKCPLPALCRRNSPDAAAAARLTG